MRCPKEKLDTIGKRTSGAGVQPIVSPDEETIGCKLICRDDYERYKLSINQCESHVKSGLDKISLNVNIRDVKKLNLFRHRS